MLVTALKFVNLIFNKDNLLQQLKNNPRAAERSTPLEFFSVLYKEVSGVYAILAALT